MTTSSEAAAVSVNGLKKVFRAGKRRITALDGISLSAPAAHITGLIGPDGAGKTTLMRLIAGLLRPDAGRIQALGTDVAREPAHVQASIGYMPQHFGLYEDLTVAENLVLYADLQGVTAAARAARFDELLSMTALSPFTARLAGRLSGGMKQKLGLACTLVRAPRLLLLDEPTVGVDPVSRRELWSIVQRLVERDGMTVLLSTSYLDEAERCDRVLLLREGKLLGEGTPQELSEPMRGRVFTAPVGQRKARHVQATLRASPGVIDSEISGAEIRVVTASADAEPTLPELELTPVQPRLEDAFVASLQRPRTSTGPAEAPGKPAPTEAQPVIEVHELTRRFGDFTAVKGISFKVKQGEIFGLLGANGAGKSTTFRMLCGLLPPSAGQARVAGVDLRRARAQARARIGYMAQRFSLYGALTVHQNLRFFASAYGLFGKRQRERVRWALEHFGLEDQAERNSELLPLGYKQRLAMACALMHEPRILFLDEPTSGVDPLERRAFWSRIGALADAGVTVLVTTHFMAEAEYCDRLVIMAAGEILAAGDPAAIRAAGGASNMEDAFIGLVSRDGQAA